MCLPGFSSGIPPSISFRNSSGDFFQTLVRRFAARIMPGICFRIPFEYVFSSEIPPWVCSRNSSQDLLQKMLLGFLPGIPPEISPGISWGISSGICSSNSFWDYKHFLPKFPRGFFQRIYPGISSENFSRDLWQEFLRGFHSSIPPDILSGLFATSVSWNLR